MRQKQILVVGCFAIYDLIHPDLQVGDQRGYKLKTISMVCNGWAINNARGPKNHFNGFVPFNLN
jgi:hypothetical protein